MELRQYQKDAIDSLWSYWRSAPNGVPLVVCPTGAGKSLLCAEIVRRVLKAAPHYRILILSHRKEIIEQNAKEIYALLEIPVGIYSAGLGKKIIHKVTCANIQSVYRKKDFPEPNLVIVDECHLISEHADSMYRKFLDIFPRAKVVGLTATPYRMDRGSLLGDLFTDIAYEIELAQLIAQGFLSPLISLPTGQMDFSKVRRSGYDYNQEELQKEMLPHIQEHAQSIIEHTKDRKCVLVFCSGIMHARQVAEALPSADYVTGDMPQFERDRKIREFRDGRTRILCNMDVLTTGFNVPQIDCIVLLRATQSVGLYVQIVGRGSRIAPNKANCLVLDYGKNIERHGPIDLIQVRHRKGDTDPQFSLPPVKACEMCGAIVHIKTTVCPNCGAEFPAHQAKLDTAPSTAQIMSAPKPLLQVHQVEYKIHAKADKPPSLRIRYHVGEIGHVDKYLCIEHGGFSTEMARRTWKLLRGDSPIPQTTQEAFERAMRGELWIPQEIKVVQRGKYQDIAEVAKLRNPKEETWQEKLGVNI